MPVSPKDAAREIFISYKKGHLSIETMKILFCALKKNFSSDEIFTITREFLKMVGDDRK